MSGTPIGRTSTCSSTTPALARAARSPAGIIERAKHFAAFSLKIEILYMLFGRTGVALSMHNTGSHNGRTLDEHLTTVMQLEGEKVKRLDTFNSEVSMLSRP
jgi:uncharacterized protein